MAINNIMCVMTTRNCCNKGLISHSKIECSTTIVCVSDFDFCFKRIPISHCLVQKEEHDKMQNIWIFQKHVKWKWKYINAKLLWIDLSYRFTVLFGVVQVPISFGRKKLHDGKSCSLCAGKRSPQVIVFQCTKKSKDY